MTKTEAETMYATAVREALGREFAAWEVEMMRELWEEDVDALDAAREIERESEARAERYEPWDSIDPEVIPGRYMTRRDAEDIRNAGRGHLLGLIR